MQIPITYEFKQNIRTFLHYEGVFTPNECRKIIDMGTNVGFRTSVVDDGVENTTYRKSKNSWVSFIENPWIIERLSEILILANREFSFDIESFDPEFQLTRYDTGDYYKWHQDFGEPNPKRKLSVVLHLSENFSYSGGELQFFGSMDNKCGNDIGSVTIFPSFEFHRVTPLKSGTRYSLVTWVQGHPFR